MKDVFSRYPDRYDAWYEKNKWAYLSELEAVKRFLPLRGSGMEIGVGTGRFSGPLGIQWGVDPSLEVLNKARKRGVRVKKAYGEMLPFRDESFDYVVSIVALSFVKDPDKVIREASRVLKKRGDLIIGIVNRESFLGRHYLKKKGIFYKNAKLFTPGEVASFLNAAEFIDLSFCQTIFLLPSQMRSVHKVIEGLSKGGFVVIRARKQKFSSG